MQAIEFNTTIHNGKVTIPPEYSHALEGKSVRIILLDDNIIEDPETLSPITSNFSSPHELIKVSSPTHLSEKIDTKSNKKYIFNDSRFISPKRDDLSSLRTPLTQGEKKVLDFFDKNLSQDWEIYIQPHLNGLRPDFVLLNPNIGIAVFEVKDWNLDAINYRVNYVENKPELWATSKDGVNFRVKDNPIEKIAIYKESIANLYCPEINILNSSSKENYFNLITAGVIFTKATTEKVESLFEPFLKRKGFLGILKPYHPIVGFDAIDKGSLETVFPASLCQDNIITQLMTPEIAQSLRSWLIEPDFAATQRRPLDLNNKQKELVTTRTRTGYRRIKGPAGSGKSLVIASRAAQLSSENKVVLVVTYNITLLHYLRDVAVRYPVNKKQVNNNVTWLHFHEWCKQVICIQAELYDEYNALWKETKDLTDVLEVEMVQLVNKVIETKKNFIYTYDAILVDEGQDYNIDWWNALRKVLRPGGEMLLAADETQDIYKRAVSWTDVNMSNAGFTGSWSTLDICYRTPTLLIKYLRDFAQKYLEGVVNLPEQENSEFDWPTHLRWTQLHSERNLEENIIQSVLDIPSLTDFGIVAYPDIVLLVPTHRLGLSCVKRLNDKKIKVIHVFDQDKQKQKSLKLAFFMGDARIKACTIHSFKGWETRYLVIAIPSKNKQSDLAAIYVALSRLKRHSEGSYLNVICSDPALEEFGRTWTEFNKV